MDGLIKYVLLAALAVPVVASVLLYARHETVDPCEAVARQLYYSIACQGYGAECFERTGTAEYQKAVGSDPRMKELILELTAHLSTPSCYRLVFLGGQFSKNIRFQ